jgi:hypothetical protein
VLLHNVIDIKLVTVQTFKRSPFEPLIFDVFSALC